MRALNFINPGYQEKKIGYINIFSYRSLESKAREVPPWILMILDKLT